MVCAPSGIEKTKIWSKEILIRKIVRRNPIQTNEISILCLIYVIKSWISIREFRILFDWILDRDTFGYIWISDIYSRKNWNTKEKWKEVKEYSEFHRSKNQCRLWEGEKAFVGDIRKKVEHSSNSKIVERFTTRPSIRSFSFFFLLFSWTIVHSCDHDSAAQTDVAPSETRNKSCCIPREKLEIPCQFLFPFSGCKKWYPKMCKK